MNDFDSTFDLNSVASIYTELARENIDIWLDGGWGVDALLQKQTRDHQDLDIVVQKKDLSKLKSLLLKKGYVNCERDDTRSCNFVLVDQRKNHIDVHVVELDKRGNGIYGPSEEGVFYPADSLTGTGYIGGVEVRCLTAEYQVKSHTGYVLKNKDYHDVLSLCKKFRITIPEEYDADF